MSKTFMGELCDAVVQAVDNEPGKTQIKGLNREQLVAAVQAIARALDSLDNSVNLHVVLFALTYMRNAVILAMEENTKVLATRTGGEG